MYHEVTIKHHVEGAGGTMRAETSRIIVGNALLFAEAEYKAMQWADDDGAEVTAIKRSGIREFANGSSDGKRIYFLTLQQLEKDEKTGKEKTLRYTVGLYANDMTGAKANAERYMSQGLDGLEMVGINQTKFREVI